MNIIICSPQGNLHRTTQATINSSVVLGISKVSDSSFLTSSISMRGRSKSGGRKTGIKNRSKVQRVSKQSNYNVVLMLEEIDNQKLIQLIEE